MPSPTACCIPWNISTKKIWQGIKACVVRSDRQVDMSRRHAPHCKRAPGDVRGQGGKVGRPGRGSGIGVRVRGKGRGKGVGAHSQPVHRRHQSVTHTLPLPPRPSSRLQIARRPDERAHAFVSERDSGGRGEQDACREGEEERAGGRDLEHSQFAKNRINVLLALAVLVLLVSHIQHALLLVIIIRLLLLLLLLLALAVLCQFVLERDEGRDDGGHALAHGGRHLCDRHFEDGSQAQDGNLLVMQPSEMRLELFLAVLRGLRVREGGEQRLKELLRRPQALC